MGLVDAWCVCQRCHCWHGLRLCHFVERRKESLLAGAVALQCDSPIDQQTNQPTSKPDPSIYYLTSYAIAFRR